MTGDGIDTQGRWSLMRRTLVTLAVTFGLVAGAVILAAWWFVGPTKVRIRNVGTATASVQVCFVQEGTRELIAEWPQHSIEAGASVEQTRAPIGDCNVQVRIAQDDGTLNRYTLRHYLGSGRPHEFIIEVAEGRLASARVRIGRAGGLEDARWTQE